MTTKTLDEITEKELLKTSNESLRGVCRRENLCRTGSSELLRVRLVNLKRQREGFRVAALTRAEIRAICRQEGISDSGLLEDMLIQLRNLESRRPIQAGAVTK